MMQTPGASVTNKNVYDIGNRNSVCEDLELQSPGYQVGPQGQYYKTFYGRNLQIFVIS